MFDTSCVYIPVSGCDERVAIPVPLPCDHEDYDQRFLSKYGKYVKTALNQTLEWAESYRAKDLYIDLDRDTQALIFQYLLSGESSRCSSVPSIDVRLQILASVFLNIQTNKLRARSKNLLSDAQYHLARRWDESLMYMLIHAPCSLSPPHTRSFVLAFRKETISHRIAYLAHVVNTQVHIDRDT